MGVLLDRILDFENMTEAWEHTRSKGKTPGVDNWSARRFQRHWEEHLRDLVAEVRANRYRPRRLRVRHIPKRGVSAGGRVGGYAGGRMASGRVPDSQTRITRHSLPEGFMATLYVTEPGARIEKEYRCLLVTKEDEVLARLPLSRVTHVVLVGNVGATTPALLALLDQEVGLALISRAGRLRGRLMPPVARNAPLRQAQYRVESDNHFCTRFARAVVCGKLRNSRTLMRRLMRRRQELPRTLLPRLESALHQAEKATSLAELRGLEGSGARAYFGLLRHAFRGDMPFEKRARRPPPDPVNALLSLGYTLLGEALMTALEVVGLDPYVGFFHADKYGRPALALDLVEEFRAPIVDSLVLTLVNKRMVGPEDFVAGHKGGVFLNRHGRRVFFREFADRLETEILHPLAGRRLSYRKIFEVQARLVARVISGKLAAYRPFGWR